MAYAYAFMQNQLYASKMPKKSIFYRYDEIYFL